ncbi:hypothetical protein Tco_1355193 [Tanacetum coccineum]
MNHWTPEIQKTLEHLGANDMLKELKNVLLCTNRRSLTGFFRISTEFQLGKTALILVSLRKEYEGFVQNYNMHSMGKTVNELHAMLKLHEQTLTLAQKEVAPALHAIRAGRIQKNQKKKIA